MMTITIMNVLIFFLFASQVLHIFGRLTVIREETRYGYHRERLLKCISEDDGAALVWNNVISKESLIESNSMQFHDVDESQSVRNDINCRMNENDDCLNLWIREDWSFTDSFKTPLGPVFDRRWEDFQEYGNFNMKYNLVPLENATAFSFSVRASSFDVQILLCNGNNYITDFCYWILLGGWGNTKSVIRRCSIGVPKPGMKAEDSECEIDRAAYFHNPLSSTEWRTFLVMWDIETRSISLYDPVTDTVFIRYQDTQPPRSRERFKAVTNSGIFNHYHMFIRSDYMMLYRFHNYSFLHTITADATLTSPVFEFNNTICVQLLVGLCANCEMDIVLHDTTGSIELKSFLVKGSSKAESHGLPTWQFVTIEHSTYYYDRAKITLTSKFSSYSFNPLWAIANVRQCPRNVSFRRSELHSIGSRDWTVIWPDVTCQKLFYNNHTVVNTVPDAKSNMALNNTVCPEGRIGPQCLFYCNRDSYGNTDCKGHVICYKEGCICPAGFIGYNCATSCNGNTYGYDCKENCASCSIPISSPTTCNKVTGACIDQCIYNENIIYIPPLCKIGIVKPAPPIIDAVDETSIKIKLPVLWKDEYKGLLLYSFTISPRANNTNDKGWKQFYQNITEVTEYFTNLKSGTIYNIACLFRVCNQYGKMCSQSIQSNWQRTETACNPAEFVLQSEENSLLIDWKFDTEQLFPCPANWYQLVVQYTDTSQSVVNTEVNQFPYKVPQKLPSYTLFTVTILHKNEKIFSQEIRTLEEAPSTVFNLRSKDIFDTNVTLSWTAPRKPNGIIEQYEVILQINKYLGCKDSTSSLNNAKTIHRTKDTIITIQNLHPYAIYYAQIIAYNARRGSEPAEINFKTIKSDVATEEFSQLKAEDWNLTWKSPEDCTTITGLLYARIKIRTINDDTEYFPIVKQTKFTYLSLEKAMLFGGEQYVARVYVIREANAPENPFAYQEIEFMTPPGVPPQVTNLEVYEMDPRQDPIIVYLRWQSPIPPLNGTLRTYSIRLCNRRICSYTEVPLNDICNLWDSYICGSVQLKAKSPLSIEVVAYNMDVLQPGSPFSVSQEMLNNLTPEEPGNFTVINLNRGIVDLEWSHPWKTGSPLHYFYIMITQLSTNLVKLSEKSLQNLFINVTVTDYMRKYKKRLYLHPSTQYHISIKAETVAGTSSKVTYKEFETPSSLKFNGLLKHVMHDSTISLNIPPIVNYTKNSVIHVIVKGPLGPKGCKGYLRVPEYLQQLADVDVSHVAWEAAEILVQQRDANKLFTIGNNKMYGKAKNCQLQPKESYDITVIVTNDNKSSHIEPIALKIMVKNGEISGIRPEAWLIPIILILIVAVVIFYFYRRKRHRTINKLMLQDEIALSQNIENYEHETKSAISNSKENLSTPSDRQSLSRATTPEILLTAIENTDNVMDTTSLVKVKDFEDYVKEAIQTELLIKQYETFPRGQTRSWDYGKLPQNKTKNRYGNLIAYDNTRVILEKLPEDPYSDYINANYITGYKKEKHYIATQGPKPNTVIDFWRMIWQENVLIICMLANVIENGKTKCEQYWPDIGKKKKYGNIIVLNSKHNVFADYCFRTFQITCGKETRKVEHLHYTAWPDHGVPLYTHSVVTYLKKLLATPPGNGSVVVHCSAGVGRTGTIILCDICLRQAAAEGVVDVFAETASIRSERANMVDNKQQYLLAHLALMECLLSIPTTLPCNETLVTRINEMKKQLSVQQQRLQNTAWQDEALRQTISPPPLSERNRAKNRFPELISDKVSRIYLTRYPASDEDSDYLSAVYVDGVKLQNQYLATQLPMPSTINDFWRMIAEFKVELILMLQAPDPQDPTCCAIAPASGEFKPTPYLNITAKETVELEYYTSQKLQLVDNSEKPSSEQSVTILCLTQWKHGRNQSPPPVMTMVTFWQAAERIARGDGATVTLCHDGVTGCGLYLALSFLLERMAVERECDVCLAVRAVRRSRPDFVRSLEHLEYLYDAAVTYLEYFETYANFS